MQRIGQPAVIGELAAGLIFGPSVPRSPPTSPTGCSPPTSRPACSSPSAGLACCSCRVSTGFETDLGLIGRLGRCRDRVGRIVAGSAIAGFAVGWFLPMAFVGSDTERYIFALDRRRPVDLVVPGDRQDPRRDGPHAPQLRPTHPAAGMANDVIGWVALGLSPALRKPVASSLTSSPSPSWGYRVLRHCLHGRARVVDTALKRVRANGSDQLSGMTVVPVTTLSFGVVTQWFTLKCWGPSSPGSSSPSFRRARTHPSA